MILAIGVSRYERNQNRDRSLFTYTDTTILFRFVNAIFNRDFRKLNFNFCISHCRQIHLILSTDSDASLAFVEIKQFSHQLIENHDFVMYGSGHAIENEASYFIQRFRFRTLKNSRCIVRVGRNFKAYSHVAGVAQLHFPSLFSLPLCPRDVA